MMNGATHFSDYTGCGVWHFLKETMSDAKNGSRETCKS